MRPSPSTPPLRELGDDLRVLRQTEVAVGLLVPIATVAGYFVFATAGLWWLAVPCVALYTFTSYASTSHDLVHRTLGLPRRTNRLLLSFIELLGLRSGTAYRLAHLHHHRRFPEDDDIEAALASKSIGYALWAGVTMQPRLWWWAYRRHPRLQDRLLAEAGLALGLVTAAAFAWEATPLPAIYLALVVAMSWALPLATVYFVHRRGESDPLRATRWFRGRFYELAFAHHLYHLEHHLYPAVPHQRWPQLAKRLAPHLEAAGVEPVSGFEPDRSLPDPELALPQPDQLGRFWLRYWLVFFALLPVIAVRQVWLTVRQAVSALATYNRSVSLLGGKLDIVYVNSLRSLLVTVFFGERFQVVRYGDKLVDPGPPFAAGRISRYVRELASKPSAILVTHAHEEHFANAGRVARELDVPVYGSALAMKALREPEKLSLMRSMMIGQPRPDHEAAIGGPRVLAQGTRLEAIRSDGHCSGHLSFYDPVEKVLLVGDSFMHEIFTSPNAEVDSHVWIETMRAYASLDVEVMIGSHGEITTCRDDIPDARFVVDRRDPNQLIARKLHFMLWARAVVRLGEERRLPYSVIEASLFPWSRTWSWKNFFVDEGARLFSGGEFSRTHFVRSLATYPERVPPRFFGRTAP